MRRPNNLGGYQRKIRPNMSLSLGTTGSVEYQVNILNRYIFFSWIFWSAALLLFGAFFRVQADLEVLQDIMF